MIDDFKLF